MRSDCCTPRRAFMCNDKRAANEWTSLMLLRHVACVSCALAFAAPHMAHAAIPVDVKRMLDEAMRRDDPSQVRVVVDIAKATSPDAAREIATLFEAYQVRRASKLAQTKRQQDEKVRRAGLLERWNGRVEFGAFHSTGNAPTTGATLGVTADRKGIEWQHSVQSRFDYQDSDTYKRAQYMFAYKPRYTFHGKQFVYGLAQFERDKAQGFDARYSLSGGLGYRLIESPTLTVAIEAGPAWRRTDFVGQTTQDNVSGLGSVDADLKLADNLKLTQDASAYVQPDSRSFRSVTAIEAGVVQGVTARLSYSVNIDENKLVDTLATDTQSRVSLVYGF